MKKSKIVLGKKLILAKDQIVSLNDQQADDVIGGATAPGCLQTQAIGCIRPTMLCPPLSRLIVCFTSPVTLACNVCH